MRLVARFKIFRNLYAFLFKKKIVNTKISKLTEPFHIKNDKLIDYLEVDGVGFGLNLKREYVEKVKKYADENLCFADRDSKKGFYLSELNRVNHVLKKDIVLAQYFNFSKTTISEELLSSEIINNILLKYFKSQPKLVGVNLWWTFPGKHLEEDKSRHAHLFHRDIDDFKFLKLFIYITDVDQNSGPHIVVKGSHRSKLVCKLSDFWRERRYLDSEVVKRFGKDITSIIGQSGTSFFENTLCLHKGTTPHNKARLVLQYEWALNDYGVATDFRENIEKIV
jgi:hypothetical protein